VSFMVAGADAGNYSVSTNSTTIADITPKAIKGSITADSKVYDATTAAVTTGSLSGVLGNDDLSLTTSGTFLDKNVGSTKTVNVSFMVAGADAGNYSVSTNSTTIADITPREISGDLIAQDKVYDALTSTSVQGVLNGVLSADDVSLTAGGKFSDKNVGTDKIVTLSNIRLTGVDARNYSVTTNVESLADITPLEVTGSIWADGKVYDATTDVLTSGDLQGDGWGAGFTDGDDIQFLTTGQYLDKNVGTNKRVLVSGVLGGIDAGNYRLVSINAETTADITPLSITGAITADSRVYDATTAATTHGSLSGLLGSDDLVMNTSGSFTNKNAGNSKTVNVNFTVSGSDAANYSVSANSTTLANITPRAITGTLVADDKIYDADTGAFTQRFIDGVLADDIVTLSARGAFADKNAGTDKTVTFSSIRLLGTDARNYTVSTNTTDTADIFIREITADIVAESKVYDGTVDASTYANLNNLIDWEGSNPDDIGVTTTGQFADRHAADAKTVTVSGELVGADKANYRLVSMNAETTADIYQRDLMVTGSTVADKVYDGLLNAQVNAGVLEGIIAGDQVAIGGTSGQFTDRHAGTGKQVTASYTLTGDSAGDYYAITDDTLTGTITPKALTITGSVAADKVYDGNVNAAITAGQLQGIIAGDVVQAAAAGGSFDNKQAGADKNVLARYTLSGNEALDYTLADQTLLADITPLALSISGSSAVSKVYDANTVAIVDAGTLSGILGSDDVTVSGAGVFADKDAGSSKAVTASYQLNGFDAGNYTLSQETLSADITRATLTIKANDASRVEGSGNPAFSINIANFVVGDNVSGLAGATFFNADASTSLGNYVSGLSGTLTFATDATSASAPGVYNVTPSGLTAGNYIISYQAGQLTIVAATSSGGGDNGEAPPGNNPVFLPDPDDINNPVIPPDGGDGGSPDGENGLLVVLGEGIRLPGDLTDDDDDNTF
ncbi:MAG: YDG domain-containing protein, partial [Fluviicoccus sp.]|uniref:YDG domain-containing protein n=1 Tax=Fluviicoccus sp. TaxID=2003552 RepID=UPI0027206C5A